MKDKEIIQEYEKEVQEEEKYYSHYGEKKQKQVELHRKILSIVKANNLLRLNKEINENIQVAYGGRRYNTEGIVIENYIPKSKVKEEYVSKKELKRIIDKNMYLEMMKELRRVLED